MFCSNCGKKVNEGAKFCWNCGSEIAAHEQTAAPEPEKQAEETPSAPVEEEKQEEAQPVKKPQPAKNKRPKLNKKSLLIAGGVLVVALLVVLIVVFSTPKVGEIPDPMYFFDGFDVSVEDYTFFRSATLSIRTREEGAEAAMLEYVNLLKSGNYPFTCVSEESNYGVTSYDFRYDGTETYSDPYYIQLEIIINPWDHKIYLTFYDYFHFDFVSREQYSGSTNTSPPSEKGNAEAGETETDTPASTSPVRVAEGVDLSYLFEKKENGVQDIRYWSEGSLQFDDDPLDMGSYTIYYLDCGKSDLNTYIDMLCRNGFTLVADYNKRGTGISGSQFIEYALVSNDVEGLSTRSGIYTKAQNHIDIWLEEYHNCWRMEVVNGLEVCDLGIRRDGNAVAADTLGESAESGLLYQDGYYTTEDGRLRSGENEATIVVDGEVMTGELYGLEKKNRNEYRFYMDGFGKGELEFSWDKRSMEEGSVFLNNLADEDISFALVLPNGSTRISSESYRGFSKLLLRVMHYDTEGDAVFYLYGETFSGHSVEALMAVNLWEMDNPTTPEPIDATGAETMDVSADTTIRIKVGETVTLHCVYSEFGSMYHTYDWSSSGSAINMSESYNKVTVKGIEPGTAEIYMTYHYTKDEPDSLTGNTRHNGHSRSRTYTIIVE